MPAKAPVLHRALHFDGVYLGVNAGYGTSNGAGTATARTRPGSSAAWVARGRCRPHEHVGGFVGGRIGANYQVGMFVFGVEATSRSRPSMTAPSAERGVLRADVHRSALASDPLETLMVRRCARPSRPGDLGSHARATAPAV